MVQCNYLQTTTDKNRKCGLFDLKTNEWKACDSIFFSLPYNADKYAQQNQVDCSMAYNYHNRSNVYLWSEDFKDEQVLLQYDIYKNKWQCLMEGFQGIRSAKNPILWMDDRNCHLLYRAELLSHSNGYKVNMLRYDVRDTNGSWNACSMDWDDLVFPVSDYTKAMLFI